MPRKQIEDIRYPAVEGLPEDTAFVLQQSFVQIVKMRWSIECIDQRIAQSSRAIFETQEILQLLRERALNWR